MATKSEAQRVVRYLVKNLENFCSNGIDSATICRIIKVITFANPSTLPPPNLRGRKSKSLSNKIEERIGITENISPKDFILTVCSQIKMQSHPTDTCIYISKSEHSIWTHFDNTPKGFSLFMLALKGIFPEEENISIYKTVKNCFNEYKVGKYNTLQYHAGENHQDVQLLTAAILSTYWQL